MADPINLAYWKNKTMQGILQQKRTPCPSCHSGNSFVKSLDGLTVMICSSCGVPIRLLIESEHSRHDVVG